MQKELSSRINNLLDDYKKLDGIEKMKTLIEILNIAGYEYYQKSNEIFSNYDYDKLYDELISLEKKLNITLNNSPTINVGYEILSELPKEEHSKPMLSLDKTKSVDDLSSFLKDKEGLLSLKLDGLTMVLTYDNGELVKAVTRGNGVVGEVVTNNARTFKNIPYKIPYKEEVILRGEAVITYSDFEKINEKLEIESQYKNPRNLTSGSVRQLNSEISKTRNIRVYIFELVDSKNKDDFKTKLEEINWINSMGFECVTEKKVNASNIYNSVEELEKYISKSDVASDGLVLTFNDKEYSKKLGTTAKFPKDSIAFKWKDEVRQTKLKEIKWSASRTGLINPIAVFEPVELEGTTVERASLHNVSILQNLELGIGDIIGVYKANMIIPQIAENLTRSNNIIIPEKCPVCNNDLEVREVKDVKVLFCKNSECPAKRIKSFAHFATRDCMNIEGLSEATLEKLIDAGMINDFWDLYNLDTEQIKNTFVEIEGFGEKSYKNLLNSIEKSKEVKIENFINALGINNVGLSNAKLLAKAYNYDIEKIMKANSKEISEIEGFGEIIGKSIAEYMKNENNISVIEKLLTIIKMKNNLILEKELSNKIKDKTFVITGSLNVYENRRELKEFIESCGGKVTGSISKKTDYLINNDLNSTSSKNKKAKDLNIPIISEEDFQNML